MTSFDEEGRDEAATTKKEALSPGVPISKNIDKKPPSKTTEGTKQQAHDASDSIRKSRLDMEAAMDAAELEEDLAAAMTDLNRNQNITTSRPGAFAVPGPQERTEQPNNAEVTNAPAEPISGSSESMISEPVVDMDPLSPDKKYSPKGAAVLFPVLPISRTQVLILLTLVLVALLAVALCVSLMVIKRKDRQESIQLVVSNDNNESQTSATQSPSPTVVDPFHSLSSSPSDAPSQNPSDSTPKSGAFLPVGGGDSGKGTAPSQLPSSQPSNGSFVEPLPQTTAYGFLGGCFFCGDQFSWEGGASHDDLNDEGNYYEGFPPTVTPFPSYSPTTATPTVSSLPTTAPSMSSNPTADFPSQMPSEEPIQWFYHPELSISVFDAVQHENCTEAVPLFFGASPSLSEDWMVLGSQGSVFVYRREHLGFHIQFHQRLFLNGTNLEAGAPLDPSFFGTSVKIEQNRIVVGATGYVNKNAQQSGAAFVFDYSEDENMWVETAILMAPVEFGRNGDLFGYALAISGDTIAVGECSSVGSRVWVFHLVDNEWVATQQLEAGPDGDFSGFGCELAMDGTTLLVGAPTQLYPGLNDTNVACGSVYVHKKTSQSMWNGTQVLSPGNCPRQTMGFGSSLAIEGNIMVVGAPLYGPGWDQSQGHGSFYIFQVNVSSGLWEIDEFNHDFEDWSNHRLGSAVAIDGDTIAVGAQWTASTASGRIELYTRPHEHSSWFRTTTIYTPAPLSGVFGSRLALLGNTLLVPDNLYQSVYTFVSTEIAPPALPISSHHLSLPDVYCPKYYAKAHPHVADCGNCWDSWRQTPGCEVESCRCAVCQVDPYCCETEWDSFCTSYVTTKHCACAPSWSSSPSPSPFLSPFPSPSPHQQPVKVRAAKVALFGIRHAKHPNGKSKVRRSRVRGARYQ